MWGGFISGRPRLHRRPPAECLNDSAVMSQIRMYVVGQRIPQRMSPFSFRKSEKRDVSSTQNARNGTSGAATVRVRRLQFRSSQDTPRSPGRVFGRLSSDVPDPYVVVSRRIPKRIPPFGFWKYETSGRQQQPERV